MCNCASWNDAGLIESETSLKAIEPGWRLDQNGSFNRLVAAPLREKTKHGLGVDGPERMDIECAAPGSSIGMRPVAGPPHPIGRPPNPPPANSGRHPLAHFFH